MSGGVGGGGATPPSTRCLGAPVSLHASVKRLGSESSLPDDHAMKRGLVIPDELRRGPFSIAEAERAGVNREQLRGAGYRRVTRGVYVAAELDDGPMSRMRGLATRLRPGCAFSGLAAALVHGLELPVEPTIEATVPPALNVTPRADLRIRRCQLGSGDVVERHGLPVTSPVRTAFDLARSLTLVEAVVGIDMALNRHLISRSDLEQYIALHGRAWGVPQARRVLDLVEPGAQSPMESRLRMLLVLRGLPRPQVQMPILDRRGRTVGYADLGYPDARLGIEYDGATHRTSLAADDRRQNQIQLAGVRLLRFTAADVYQRPREVSEEVRAALPRSA